MFLSFSLPHSAIGKAAFTAASFVRYWRAMFTFSEFGTAGILLTQISMHIRIRRRIEELIEKLIRKTRSPEERIR
jgi:predicted TIM-barrel enzyme